MSPGPDNQPPILHLSGTEPPTIVAGAGSAAGGGDGGNGSDGGGAVSSSLARRPSLKRGGSKTRSDTSQGGVKFADPSTPTGEGQGKGEDEGGDERVGFGNLIRGLPIADPDVDATGAGDDGHVSHVSPPTSRYLVSESDNGVDLDAPGSFDGQAQAHPEPHRQKQRERRERRERREGKAVEKGYPHALAAPTEGGEARAGAGVEAGAGAGAGAGEASHGGAVSGGVIIPKGVGKGE